MNRKMLAASLEWLWPAGIGMAFFAAWALGFLLPPLIEALSQ